MEMASGQNLSFRFTIVLLIFVAIIITYGQTVKDLPASAADATLTIIKLTTGGDDAFHFTVDGPTSFEPIIDTSSGFTGEVVVYHTFDVSEQEEVNTSENLYLNSGTFGHNADAYGLSSRHHSSLEPDTGMIGDSIFLESQTNAILGNWVNQDQWNFLVDDQTSKYSINFWIKGAFSLSAGEGTPILSTLKGEDFGFDLFVDDALRPDILIYNNGNLVQTINSLSVLENDNWHMVTFVIDKTQEFNTATIWVNATNPVSQDRTSEFEPLESPPNFTDQPLVIGDFNAVRADYTPKENDFFIDDLCIVKDYAFSQSDVEELYDNGAGVPCAEITGSGDSITDIPVLSLFDNLGGDFFDISSVSSDFVIGNKPSLGTNVTVTKVRLWVNNADLLSQGTLQAVVLSNITQGTSTSGQEVVEAISDSIDFSDPRFSSENYFVTFNFTSVENYSSTDILVGIKGTGLDGSLLFGQFSGTVGGGTESICTDLSNPVFVWDYCANIFAGIDNLMFEVNIEGNGTSLTGDAIQNREIDDVNYEGGGGLGVEDPTPVDSGTYSVSETVPFGWSLNTASCNDGSSSFSVDTISGILVGPGDDITCTFENEFVGIQDSDGDGILDDIDTLPFAVSDDFSDAGLGGLTSGTITTRGDQTLTISEEANPDGVRIAADISGGILPAVVEACGGISVLTINSGDELVVTCGNITIQTDSGTVDLSFILTGQAQADTSLAQLNTITFDQSTFAFSAPPTNTLTIILDVQGTPISLLPGSSLSFGLLSISKTTTGGDDTFDFTVSGPTSYNPSIDTSISGGLGADGPRLVNTGTHSVSETVPFGWSLTAASCNDGSSSFSIDTISGILVGPGDDITCTFENEFLQSTLTIIKQTTGGDDTFDFTVSGPTSYNPSLTTSSGNSVPNLGTLGSSADARYVTGFDDFPTDFEIFPNGIGGGGSYVSQDGTATGGDRGEIRLGATVDRSQWDFLHQANIGFNKTSINIWVRGDLVGSPDYSILDNLHYNENSPTESNGFFFGSRSATAMKVRILEDGDFKVSAFYPTSLIPPDDGNWHMLSLMMDKGNTSQFVKLCLDGSTNCATFDGDPFTGAGDTADHTLAIGTWHFTEGNGATDNAYDVDDVTVWQDYTISASDIDAMWSGGVGSSAGATGQGIQLAKQVGHWNFDSVQGAGPGIGMGAFGPTQVDFGTYSVSEAISSNWSLNAASCNDGSSSFSVDTISGILVGPGDDITCTFENEFVGIQDSDGDGILDDIDTLPFAVSDDFSDAGLGGLTSGTITTRGDQTLTISEELDPDGVRIVADPSGGILPAVVEACGGISIISLTPGDNIVVTCSSITIDVFIGPVEATFVGSEGTLGTSTLPAGNSITFDDDTFSFSSPDTNTVPVVVVVDGKQIIINPGNAATVLSAAKDSFIKQGESNTNEGANTMIRVRENGNNRALVYFDQGQMLDASQQGTLVSATLRLYIEENGNNWGPNGRTIDVHRLLEDWTEGNGFNDKPSSMSLSQFNALKTRGEGAGLTWKCATDSNIENQQTDCSTHWNGATYDSPTDTVTIFKNNPPTGTVKTVGWIEFDVTADLEEFLSSGQNYGWIIKKTAEGDPGLVEFSSSESGANAPELVLVLE
jgi:hypothetical protein